MNIILKMNDEMLLKVNEFIDSEGTCRCGKIMEAKERKLLIAMPCSHNTSREGSLEIHAVCFDCDQALQQFRDRKNRQIEIVNK